MEIQVPPPKGENPKFSAHVSCGQTAGWIKMPLGMEVGLGPGPGDIVLDGDRATPTPKNGRQPPNFRPMSIVAKRLDASGHHGMEVDLGPGNIVLDGNPALTSPKGAQPPIFGPCPLWSNGWMD